jgi:hypothetical protein
VFHKEGDFADFVKLVAAANERLPMRVLAYFLLSNHFRVFWVRSGCIGLRPMGFSQAWQGK